MMYHHCPCIGANDPLWLCRSSLGGTPCSADHPCSILFDVSTGQKRCASCNFDAVCSKVARGSTRFRRGMRECACRGRCGELLCLAGCSALVPQQSMMCERCGQRFKARVQVQ